MLIDDDVARQHNAKDLDFFVNLDGDQREAELLRHLGPHTGVGSKDFTLLPGLDLALTPGHAPGSSMAMLSSGTSRALLLGDAIHCPAELLDEE